MSDILSPIKVTYNKRCNTKQYNRSRSISPLIGNCDSEDHFKHYQHSFKIEFNENESSRYSDSYITNNTRNKTNWSSNTTTKKRTKLKKQVRFIDMIDNPHQLCEVIEIQAYKNSKFINLKELLISLDQKNNQCCCKLF